MGMYFARTSGSDWIFQHERLIHLIVTVTFAVITVLSLFAPLLTGIMTLYGFTMLLLVLLVPYIFITIHLKTKHKKCMHSTMK